MMVRPLVEGAHDQLVLPVDAFETHGWIVGEARGHRAVGLIQLVASRGTDRFWARTVAKRSTHDRPRRLPLGASQESAPRIGIPPARRHEDIPPAQRLAQLVEDAEGVGLVIDRVVRAVHVSPPGCRHDRRRRHVMGPRRRFTTLERLERCDDSRAGRSGLTVHLVQEGWQEQPHASVPRLPLGVEHVIRRPHPCAQCPEGLGQGGAGDTRDHVVAQHGVRKSGIEERRAGVRQREGKRIEILTAAQPCFPIRFFGGTKDVASPSVEDLERVILCGGFERVDERDHRGGSA